MGVLSTTVGEFWGTLELELSGNKQEVEPGRISVTPVLVDGVLETCSPTYNERPSYGRKSQ